MATKAKKYKCNVKDCGHTFETKILAQWNIDVVHSRPNLHEYLIKDSTGELMLRFFGDLHRFPPKELKTRQAVAGMGKNL